MTIKFQCAAILLPALVLAACSRGPQADDASAPQQVPPAATTGGATPATIPLGQALPGDVRPSFAYNLRRDRIEQTGSGAYKRAIWLEYLDMDRQQAQAALTSDFTAAGYKAGKPKQDRKGRTRLTFVKQGEPKIAVAFRVGGKLEHPSARGMIYISIPTQAPAEGAQGKTR